MIALWSRAQKRDREMLDCSQLCSLPDLPSLPSVASQLLELVSHAETDSSEVIRTLRADPAIAAKLVKTANSAMFGAASPVIGLERCVSILGSAATNAIALRFSFLDDAQPLQPNSEFYLSVWHQSLVQSIAAEQLARRTDPGCVDDFALCGLLLEIGRLAFLSQYPREYPALLKTQAKSHQSLVDAETDRKSVV